MESVLNYMRMAILLTPIKLLALYKDDKYTRQYRVVNTNVYCLETDSTDWTRHNDMIEVRDFYDFCVSCNWENWIISNDYLKLEIQTGKTGISHKQWQSLVQSLEACCWFTSNIVHIMNILLTCAEGGNECLQFIELALWSLYIRYCHMPNFLYIKKKYLQPPIKLAESTLPEQSVVQEKFVPTNVPTNPLADLPGLR